jgi:hypothetical protein
MPSNLRLYRHERRASNAARPASNGAPISDRGRGGLAFDGRRVRLARRMALAVALLAMQALAPLATAATVVGDGGHYLRYAPKVYLYNPAGQAFTVTVHLMRWPIAAWNPTSVTLRLSDPAGNAVVDGNVEFEAASKTFAVPAGAKGVYLLEMNLPARHVFHGPDFWVESSLDHSVVFTGDPHATEVVGNALAGRWLVVQCSVPRRWWFWVPPGTKSFTARTQWIQNYQSQREDWGITIFSPRGQRVRRLWGDLDYDRGRPFDTPQSRTAVTTVNVEPGAAGRFWCVELRFADSHNYSKISFSLDGVPPFVARSPEEWFDPAAAEPVPRVPIYDDDAFIQSALDAETKKQWPWLAHFSPCPALGDPDGAQVRGNAEFALWNPEDRPLKFRIGTYLPRDTAGGEPLQARIRITGADGRVVHDKLEPMRHIHGDDDASVLTPATGKGVARVTVTGTERWLAYTYPATPLVLLGRDAGEGWSRFNLEVGTARNWYFFVPKGTPSFLVRAAAQHETDRLLLEVNAPDRTVEMIYGRTGEVTVAVSPGLDGKVWHLRADIGSGSVMTTDGGPESRFLGIYATIDLRGVPGLLSPTWEQWFDPARPAPAMQRGRK